MFDLWLHIIGALALFLLGLRLSAFFSGAETGFYRISFVRLSIDANAGDAAALRLLKFAQDPAYFVATTLIGNNIANYLTTFAIGVGAAKLFSTPSALVEISAAILVSPIVFVFGELMPKNLYYRAPMSLLRRDLVLFTAFYRLFWVTSLPLIWITKLIQRLQRPDDNTVELVLGRKRLVQVLSEGREEGLLSDIQNRLVHSLLNLAVEPVTSAMTPSNRVLGVDLGSSADEILEYARRFGLTSVTIKDPDTVNGWNAYYRVIDVTIRDRPLASLIKQMPSIDAASNKLEALCYMREAGAAFAQVCDKDSIIGVISERGLVENLVRAPQKL